MRAEAALDPRSAQELIENRQEVELDTIRHFERGLIATAWLEPLEIPEHVATVQAHHFHFADHGKVWAQVQQYASRGEPSDLFVIAKKLEGTGIGPAELADIYSEECSPASVPSYVRFILKKAGERERKKLAADVAQGLPAEKVAERTASLIQLEGGVIGKHPLLERAMTARDLLSAELEDVPSLVGEGLVVRGGLSVLGGQSGMGKTFLSIQLLHACSAGVEWLGFPCERIRVGLLELEMPAASIRSRIAKLAGDLRPEWLENIHVLALPDIVFDITSPEHQKLVIDFIRESGIDLLVVDPLNKTNLLDENKANEMGLVLSAFHAIRGATGCSLLINHHLNKTTSDPGTPPKTAFLRALRGSGRLSNDPDSVIGLLEGPGGMLNLTFAKTRFREEPSDLWLRRDDNGFFSLTKGPSERVDATRDKIEKYLLLHTEGTASEIAEGTGLSTPTVRSHTLEIHGVAVVSENPRRYRLVRFDESFLMSPDGRTPEFEKNRKKNTAFPVRNDLVDKTLGEF